ncbi:hypothetical protein RMB03_17480 [Acinetobacter sp. V91_7]|uniref:hypothetical protein n=1 Tax=unclassified Acinetobacter TaxID=196816 RepID=UPI00287EC7C1|nr:MULTISPECIES: hypothetical protein [unclassified Acinetobacter]MDS7935651.1 hypothetical protein [Acinetobacter sp. V91_4B]MDS7964741.1 hypothetical protein [Acinetobacter sp. V91_7]MDS8025564.1 hypothetical protein [Acinetobacter sp. V91_13]
MNMAVQQHILQAVDWSKFDLEGWLRQFYAWSDGRTQTILSMIKVPVDKKMTQEQREALIAEYMLLQDYKKPKPLKVKCLIDDNEARAVQRLILDMQGRSEVMDEWMNAIITRYFLNKSWLEMVNQKRTQHDAREDVSCGLAALHCKYPFIRFDLKNREK